MTRDTLGLVLVLEAIAVAVLIAVQLYYATAEWQRRRNRPRLDAARQAVVMAVASDRMTEATVTSLKPLRPEERDEVLCSVAAGVKSQHDPTFEQLAAANGTDRRIERELRSRRWWVRLAALRRLTVLGLPSSEAAELVFDRDPRVRAAAAGWAATVAPGDETAAQLAEMLGDGSDLVRHRAADSILSLGNAAAASLGAGLQSDDATRKRGALAVVAAMGDPVLAAEVWPMIDDPDPQLQAEALRAVVPLLTERHAELLEERLRQPDELVRRAAVEAAGSAGLVSLAGAIAGLLDDEPDMHVGEAAIVALGELGAGGELLLRHLARRMEAVA